MFSGMFTCAECGSAITGDIKKGKYIYYRCANKTRNCSHKSLNVKQETIEKQFEEAVRKVNITSEHKKAIARALKESHIEEEKFHQEQIKNLQLRCEKLRNRISNIYTDKLDGEITYEFWIEKNNEWTFELTKLQNLITAHDNANKNYKEKGVAILELAENIYSQYIQETDEEKVNLLNILSSNFLLTGEKVSYEYKKPFDILAEGLSCTIDLGRKDSNL